VHNESMRLPPVGNFAPPSLGGREKKKKSEPFAQPPSVQQLPYSIDSNAGVAVSSLRGGPPKKTTKPANAVAPREASPTLVPAAPELLPPPSRSSNLQDEIAFFDKVKKFIGSKQTYNEFLKIINLFSQKIIDKNVLVERVDGFLGSNKELMDWFKRFVQYEGKPLHIENITYKKHNLELSLCRSYGPSYRLLPKTETMMPCSGRDEMCWEVLNDEWVVHPTWASEDSGFVAHRKNQYEEILYRVEEERHEYDYYIGSNLRTIQMLETIANRVANMNNDEKSMFKLPVGLGHSSTIYQKIIRKIYDKEKGLEVIEALHENPAVAVPIVLRRLKQKDEEWKRAHREWNKVWRETEQKVFYKSLDHIGLTFKQTDKKLLTSRNLVAEITTIKAEQNSKRKNPSLPMAKSQLSFTMSDSEVILDILRLVVCYLEHGGSYSSNDRERMETFFKTFLELFFGLPPNLIADRFADNIGANKSLSPESEADTSSGRKRPRDTTGDLLRDVLKRSKQSRSYGNNDRQDQTPETVDTEFDSPAETPRPVEDGPPAPRFDSGETWLRHTTTATPKSETVKDGQPRTVFNLFGNTTIYVFVRLLQILYIRMEEVKGYERVVSKEIASSHNVDFANDLGLYDTKLADMGMQFEPEDCYGQLLNLSEKLMEGEIEHQWFEEAIRQAYRNRAHEFYTIDKVVQALVKHAHSIVTDSRSSEVLALFQDDRNETTSDVKAQIAYRMNVKKIIGPDENLFRIDWDNDKRRLGFQFLGSYDLTMKDVRKAEDKWNYYLTSYMMSVPTEGVPLDQIKAPLLYRSMIENVDEDFPFVIVEQGLMARVCMNTYKLFFEAGTVDYFTRPSSDWEATRTSAIVESRKARWNGFLDGPDGWKADLNDADIQHSQDRFNTWKQEGPEGLKNWKPKPVERPQPAEKEDNVLEPEPGDTTMEEPSESVEATVEQQPVGPAEKPLGPPVEPVKPVDDEKDIKPVQGEAEPAVSMALEEPEPVMGKADDSEQSEERKVLEPSMERPPDASQPSQVPPEESIQTERVSPVEKTDRDGDVQMG
jgi:paired amphipathic helix protein Sin3a